MSCIKNPFLIWRGCSGFFGTIPRICQDFHMSTFMSTKRGERSCFGLTKKNSPCQLPAFSSQLVVNWWFGAPGSPLWWKGLGFWGVGPPIRGPQTTKRHAPVSTNKTWSSISRLKKPHGPGNFCEKKKHRQYKQLWEQHLWIKLANVDVLKCPPWINCYRPTILKKKKQILGTKLIETSRAAHPR